MRQGKSQKDIADAFGCSQSRISKLENGTDEEMRLGDLSGYLEALGLESSMLIVKANWQAMDQIKYHAFEIQRCLTRLADLAKDDHAIDQGVAHAHVETLVNVINIISNSAKDLPEFPLPLPAIVEASGGEDVAETCEGATASVPV